MLASMHVIKGDLSSIYRECETEDDALQRLSIWDLNAAKLNIPELTDMAVSVITHLEGIATYWLGEISNAAREGLRQNVIVAFFLCQFNNKKTNSLFL